MFLFAMLMFAISGLCIVIVCASLALKILILAIRLFVFTINAIIWVGKWLRASTTRQEQLGEGLKDCVQLVQNRKGVWVPK